MGKIIPEYKGYKAFAKFSKDLGYRTKTQLRLNDAENNCIGTIIMLNPGDSKPINPKGETLKVIENEDKWYQCSIDNTMYEIINILKSAYPLTKKGYIRIVNLSNLRNTKPKELLKNPEFKTPNLIVNEIGETPWVWLAWMCIKKSGLNKVQKILEEHIEVRYKNKYLGVKGTCGYYHPLGIKFSKKSFDKEKGIIDNIRKFSID